MFQPRWGWGRGLYRQRGGWSGFYSVIDQSNQQIPSGRIRARCSPWPTSN